MSSLTSAISYATANIVSTKEKGAAFTINLPVVVTVSLLKDNNKRKKFFGEPSFKLKNLVMKTLKFLKHDEYSLKIKVNNQIPEGLGKEEAFSLALVFATVGAIAKRHGSINELKIDKYLKEQFFIVDERVVNKIKLMELCLKRNKESKIKFEKLAASFYGGFVVTDNKKRKILRRGEMEEEIFLKINKIKSSKEKEKMKKVENELIQTAWNEALKGNLYTAMTLNSLILNEKVKEFYTSKTLSISLSSPYLIQLYRSESKRKRKFFTINQGVKILEKPTKIFKTREFLKLKGARAVNLF